MGFFSSFFRRKQNEQPVVDLAFYQKVVNRIVVSETVKNQLAIKLKQAFEDPKSFYDNSKDFSLSERGLRYPEDSALTPKFVMIDTLLDNGEMTEVDWKESESEVRTYLMEIGMAKGYDFEISEDDKYEGHHTGEIIDLIDEKELRGQGY